ncbi:hypothetical protein [Streptomyces sp. NBC_00467]|uniref:hypothetical protein n=1 Tax=Streptomyces sp. NBC_00467 TaxID=2975752 RepID=UPI002E177628
MDTDDTTSAGLLDHILRQSSDPHRRILFTGASIVTMDADLGVLVRGDLLVEGDTITAVAWRWVSTNQRVPTAPRST